MAFGRKSELLNDSKGSEMVARVQLHIYTDVLMSFIDFAAHFEASHLQIYQPGDYIKRHS